jgi:hypothetical protein
MAEAQNDLWHDVSVILKHIRFIVALFAVAIVVAVATGLAMNTESRATSEAEIDIKAGTPLFGADETVPTLDTLADLAESDEVTQAATEGLSMDPAELRNNVTVRTEAANPADRDSVDRLSIEATGTSKEQAKDMATAVMDAFTEAAEGLGSDPRGLELLREQETLALQRLQEFDQEQLFELAQVQTDLGVQRRLLTSLPSEVSAIDQALELVQAEGSRPLGELVVAVSGVLGGSQGIEQASTVEELRGGLELRRELTGRLMEETQLQVSVLEKREQELLLDTADQSAALSVYNVALRDLQAADLAAAQTETEVTVTASGVDTSESVDWLTRLGAAAAFGLVVGVAAAFALEFLAPYWQRWRRGTAG